jgi:DNA-binding NarL/FixJ family response regulator
MKAATRLILISRHKLMTEALYALFQRERNVHVVGHAADEAAALQLAARTNADVAIVDMVAQVLNAFSIVRQLKKQSPTLGVVALSMWSDEAYMSQVLRSGASAFVLRTEGFGRLARAVQDVAAGRRYLSPQLNIPAIRRRQKAANSYTDDLDKLTAREREVLQLATEGCTNARIAARLGISRRTVETHRANIYKKLLVGSHTELVAFALRRGLLTRDL